MSSTSLGSLSSSLKTPERNVKVSRFHISWRQNSTSSIGQNARDRILAFEAISSNNVQLVARVTMDDLLVGRLLGAGGFSIVRRVKLLDSDGTKCYAIKSLRPDIVKDEDQFALASVDMGMEAKILASIRHPNIIRMHAVSAGSVIQQMKDGTLFLMMDYLEDTLDKRLDRWRTERRKKPIQFYMKEKRSSQRLVSRLDKVALGIARALHHCHSLNIIYRDLKPQNIGFDEEGVVKLFDFGLARECAANSRFGAPMDQREMTGGAGTPRFMAPEVALKYEYGFPADVYSFSIILWELVTLKRAFQSVHPKKLKEKITGGERPSLKGIKSEPLYKILARGWSEDPKERPKFAEICGTIEYTTRHLNDTIADKQQQKQQKQVFPRLSFGKKSSTMETIDDETDPLEAESINSA